MHGLPERGTLSHQSEVTMLLVTSLLSFIIILLWPLSWIMLCLFRLRSCQPIIESLRYRGVTYVLGMSEQKQF